VSHTYVQIRHTVSDTLIAEGPLGWGITPFEGNYYISSKYLLTDGFRINWLPNPLLSFIWFRVAVPQVHPEISVKRYEKADS
jgi:hypothetical protein